MNQPRPSTPARLATRPRPDGQPARAERAGFTLVEMMIVVACVVLLLAPMLLILRSGAQVSRKGMVQIDTTMQARRILHLIHDDLKNACVSTGNRTWIDFPDLLQEAGTAPTFQYVFCRFPFRGEISQTVPAPRSGFSPRRASRVRYTVEKPTGSRFLHLIREETFHPSHPLAATFPGGTWRRVLTERVNYFRIQPWEIPDPSQPGSRQFVWWVTLQLVDVDPSQRTPPAPSGDLWTDRGKGLIIADFYDVVYPEFFNAFWRQPLINRNWHTIIEEP
ncbi:MAG: hypothetical protein OZSIB_0094 [Candidatus Ozemobacter sibiricus]|uniref:Prepilin-type N-terminal cleavage/methylation domain-containing protein n=1 Tax=Candidatus Ozemobacter sibiricus TaxID=2268124 RepID=A0A367ZMU2_9BACT|nr:MAG: hypothetical protein OZSIB_0094 [Candidatus Ozemobacter sibiricus]